MSAQNDTYINLENAQEIVDELKKMIDNKPDVITSASHPSDQSIGGTWEQVLNGVEVTIAYSGSTITSSTAPVSQNVGDVWDEII